MIIRAKRKTNFTMISNTGLSDKNLSFKAKGVLAYMLSLPDDWVFYETELTNHATDGRDSVRSALKELEKHGYLVREQSRTKGGKFSEIDWRVYDEPSTENPSTVKPSAVNPTSENPTLLNTNKPNTNKLNTNNTKDILSGKAEPRIPFKEIIDYLNEKTGSRYKHTSKKTQSLIKARVNESFTLDDFKKVIDIKTDEWKDTDMSKFLRPETLFGTKFESYLNQKQVTKGGYDGPTRYDELF